MELYFHSSEKVASAIKNRGYKLSDYLAKILDVEHIPPTPIYRFVDIDGRDEIMDLTEAFGEIVYKNDRKLVISFDIPENPESVVNFNALCNQVHGKSFYFVIGNNSEKVYHGRFSVNSSKIENISYGFYELEIKYLSYKTVGGVL